MTPFDTTVISVVCLKGDKRGTCLGHHAFQVALRGVSLSNIFHFGEKRLAHKDQPVVHKSIGNINLDSRLGLTCKLVLQPPYQAHGVCGRAAGNAHRTQKKQTGSSESRHCTNSVVAIKHHCSYKAPTTKTPYQKNYALM